MGKINKWSKTSPNMFLCAHSFYVCFHASDQAAFKVSKLQLLFHIVFFYFVVRISAGDSFFLQKNNFKNDFIIFNGNKCLTI